MVLSAADGRQASSQRIAEQSRQATTSQQRPIEPKKSRPWSVAVRSFVVRNILQSFTNDSNVQQQLDRSLSQAKSRYSFAPKLEKQQ